MAFIRLFGAVTNSCQEVHPPAAALAAVQNKATTKFVRRLAMFLRLNPSITFDYPPQLGIFAMVNFPLLHISSVRFGNFGVLSSPLLPRK